MSILKIIFTIVAIWTVVLFIASWLLWDALWSVNFLMGESYGNLYWQLDPIVAAVFLLAVVTLVAAVWIL